MEPITLIAGIATIGYGLGHLVGKLRYDTEKQDNAMLQQETMKEMNQIEKVTVQGSHNHQMQLKEFEHKLEMKDLKHKHEMEMKDGEIIHLKEQIFVLKVMAGTMLVGGVLYVGYQVWKENKRRNKEENNQTSTPENDVEPHRIM